MADLVMPMLLALVRHGVAAFGVYLGTYGITVSGSGQDQLVGAGMVIVSVGLSFMDKLWAKWKARTGAVLAARASAEATIDAGRATPVTVVVTPAGVPNEAVRVSPSEAAPPTPPGNVPPSPRRRLLLKGDAP
jgi:hypothetical protein